MHSIFLYDIICMIINAKVKGTKEIGKMRLSDREFYLERLDRSIPEINEAADLYSKGDEAGAMALFVRYFKDSLRDDLIFKNNPTPSFDGLPKGHTLESYAELILNGYCHAIDYLHKYDGGRVIWDYNPTYNGYVEYCFHLNLHGECSVLAYRYRDTKDERYAKRFFELMRSWLDDTECPGKVLGDAGRPTWRSIESGGRMIRWPAFFAALKDSPSIPDSLWFDMAKSIPEHMHRLIGIGTTYNWHTSEISGILSAALFYPCFRERDEWREYAVSEFIKQYRVEIYPDGMQAELSSGYQSSVAYCFRRAKHLLMDFGYEAPSELSECVRLVMSSYLKLARPDLRTPGLNDAGALYVPAVLKKCSDIYPDDEYLEYVISERRAGKEPPFRSVVMPYSGFVVMRTGWDADAMWSLFDVGPEGTAHIHEDKLNFQLYAYGERMLDDIGFYAYDTSDMRYFTISSLAHNTGLVDGEGQNRIATHEWVDGIETVEIQTPAFGKIVDKNKLCDLCYSDDDQTEVAEAAYSGDYGAKLTRATHRRKVVFFKRGLGSLSPFYLLLDDFSAEDGKDHEFSICFQHRALPIKVEERSTKLFFENGATLTVASDVCPSILLGQYSPRYVGWNPIHSPYPHEHQPAPFEERKKRGTTARFATVLYPSREACTPEISVALTDTGFVINTGKESFEFNYDDPVLRAEKYTV